MRTELDSIPTRLFADPNRYEELWRRLEREGVVAGFEARGLRRDKSPIWLSVNAQAVRSKTGELLWLQGSLQDITQHKLAESRLLRESFHDSVTGLVNRAMFLNHLEKAVARARRREKFSFALASMDIDRFHIVNESLGAQVGDEVLAAVARVLTSKLRTEDICARLSGDEFALLLSDVSETADALRVINRINAALEEPIEVQDREIFISVTSGIVMSSSQYHNSEDMLRDADAALHRAKADPAVHSVLYDESMQRQAVERLQRETDLRKALDRGEFRLYYQPIVELDQGRIMAFEALIRWIKPGEGLIPPMTFVPLLEETGLILPIGDWVLRQACMQLAAWRGAFPESAGLMMSVNVSAKQLKDPGLPDRLQTMLAETGLAARWLKLEFTESVLMEESDASRSTLERLKALGVSLSMDDFGTGYSSLAYLHRFPLDVLKIDKSFVMAMRKDSHSSAIVRAILVLAKNLDLEVIAEGIETSAQLAQLMEMGCGYGQGYYFSKPVDREDATIYLARGLPD